MHRTARLVVLACLLAGATGAFASDGLRLADGLQLHPVPDDGALPAFLMGDEISRDAEGRVVLDGHAQVRRLDGVVKGDRITYDQRTGEAEAQGNGLLMRDGHIVRGPRLRFNVDRDTGTIDAPQFWLGARAGAGTAAHAEMLDRQNMRLTQVHYSGCNCENPAWFIDASRVDLHLDEDVGTARNGVLRFKGVPILYSPYLSFPLGTARKSGFLMPTYGTSSNAGIELTVPYYLNLAPNFDATLSPRYMSKRGLLMGAELRHLGARSATEFFGTYIQRDQITHDKRWLYSLQSQHDLPAGLNLSMDLRKVSDDDYFRDFASFGLSDAAVTYVPSQALLQWARGPYLSASLQLYRYQTLQDSTGEFLSPPYDKLPEFNFTAQRFGWNGFDVNSTNTITRFVAPIYRGPAFAEMRGIRLQPNGTRMSSYTSVARPFVSPSAYLTPKVGLHVTRYDTQWFDDLSRTWGALYANRERVQTRVLPIASLDAGLTLERSASLFGNAAVQTLEPRLYYLYIPYRDQSELPVYDTSLATFNYLQAFDENIFSGGWDRIANANQLTVGLTSRWLDADSGFERLSLSAAQRFYFVDQRVTLPSRTARHDTESDYLLSANAWLTDRFNVHLDGQFDHQSLQRERLSAGVRWTPKRLASVAVSYRYERDPNAYATYDVSPDVRQLSREQVSINGQWPFSARWSGIGRYDYSLAEKRGTQAIVGVEYKGEGGWLARVVMQRYAASAGSVNTALFLQLELTGLGSLGTDPMSLLSDRITGYQSMTPSIPEKTIFERYE